MDRKKLLSLKNWNVKELFSKFQVQLIIDSGWIFGEGETEEEAKTMALNQCNAETLKSLLV